MMIYTLQKKFVHILGAFVCLMLAVCIVYLTYNYFYVNCVIYFVFAV